MTVQTLTHPVLGTLIESQGPFATYFSENDDYDLSLFIDEETGIWLVKLEVDWFPTFSDRIQTAEKDFALDGKYLQAYGRGAFTNRMEELYDKVAHEQLDFLPIWYRGEIRNHIMDLMQEAFDRIDAGEMPQ